MGLFRPSCTGFLRSGIVLSGIAAAVLAITSPSIAATPSPAATAGPGSREATLAQAALGFGPGDVYRENIFDSYGTAVCDNQATNAEATQCRENEANMIRRDLSVNTSGMTRAELVMEHWGGHIATTPQLYRVNSSSELTWQALPSWGGLPGPEHCYLRINLGKSIVPLTQSQLVNGNNTFDFRSGPQNPDACSASDKRYYNYGWGLYYIYSFGVRTYLDPSSTTHPSAVITSTSGATVGEEPTFNVDISGSPVPVRRIELIGNFHDYDWDGNGVYKEWQYWLRKPTTDNPALASSWWVQGTIGSATVAPDTGVYTFTWNNRFVPDQSEPVQIMARLIGENGVIANTPAITVRFERQGVSVKMYTGSVIENFAVRDNQRKSAPITISATDGLETRRAQNEVSGVRLAIATWGGKPETKEPLQIDNGDGTFSERVVRSNISLRDPTGGGNHVEIAANIACNTDLDGRCIGDTQFAPRDEFGYNGAYDQDSITAPTAVVNALRSGTNGIQIFSNRETHGLEVSWPGPALVVRYKGTFAHNRTYSLNEDTATPVQLVGSTSRTSGGGPATLYYRVRTQPLHGTLSGQPDNSGSGLSYTPAQNYNGADSFTFEVSTNSNFTTDVWEGTVTLNVAPVNDVPVIELGSAISVKLGNTLAAGGSFTDPDQDTWSGKVTYGDGSAEQPIVLGANQSFTLSHLYAQFGTYNLTVTIDDGKGGVATDTATVTVAADPVQAVADTVATSEGVAVTVNVLANDTQGSGGVVITITGAPSHGTATVNAGGTITYTPSKDYNGSDSFEYTLRDSAGTMSSARVTVAVASNMSARAFLPLIQIQR